MPHRGIEPASAAFRSDAVPTDLHPHPLGIKCTDATVAPTRTRNGELRTQKLKSHLVRTQSLNVLPVKHGVGQYIAIHATFTARDFFLACLYPPGPSTCIFSKPLPIFSCVGCDQHRFLCRPAEQNRTPCWKQVPVLSAHGI